MQAYVDSTYEVITSTSADGLTRAVEARKQELLKAGNWIDSAEMSSPAYDPSGDYVVWSLMIAYSVAKPYAKNHADPSTVFEVVVGASAAALERNLAKRKAGLEEEGHWVDRVQPVSPVFHPSGKFVTWSVLIVHSKAKPWAGIDLSTH